MKQFAVLLVSLLTSWALAGPAQSERHPVCYAAAQFAAQAQAAKRMGMTQQMFKEALAEMAEDLKETELTVFEQRLFLNGVQEGWNAPVSMPLPNVVAAAYEQCMKTQEV